MHWVHKWSIADANYTPPPSIGHLTIKGDVSVGKLRVIRRSLLSGTTALREVCRVCEKTRTRTVEGDHSIGPVQR